MKMPFPVRRTGVALTLAVLATSVASSGIATTASAADRAASWRAPDAVTTWSARVWAEARAGDARGVDGLFAGMPDAKAPAADAAATPSTRTAMALVDGIARLEAGRRAAEAARDGERAEALAEMRKALADDNRALALRQAVIAQSHAADYDAFLEDEEVMNVVRWAEQQVAVEEANRNWIDAQEILYLLRTFYEDTAREDAFRAHERELEIVNGRVMLLSRYAPEALHEMRADRAERLGDGDIGEFNAAQVVDYRERLDGVDRRMLYALLSTAAEDHIESQGWRPLLEGGLDALETFASTVPLRSEFPRLGDAAAVLGWSSRLDQWREQLDSMADRQLGRRVCIAMLEDLIEVNGVTVELPDEIIVREFGDGAMNRLDVYSDIVWPDEARRFDQQTAGDFVGIGILIRHNDRQEIEIVNPLEGTPAYKAGVMPGDIIVSVAGDSTVGWTLNDAVDRITGKRNTIVKLGLRSADADPDEVREVAIRRQVIKIASVKGWEKTGIEADGEPNWNWLIDDTAGIGYVRLTQFTDSTYRDLLDAWDEMSAQYGATPNGLILDLRHNPGGLLTAAVQISNLWVDRGTIVTGENRDQQQVWRQQAISRRAPIAEAGVSTVVLVNKGSASASEIVAGALQAHGAAVVVGDRSFGKGSVQTVHQVGRTGRIKLTTQYYRLPSSDGGLTPGRLVHKRDDHDVWGVDPDVEVEMTVRQTADALGLRQRAERAFLVTGIDDVPAAAEPDADAEPREELSSDINDLLTEGIDPQLQTAVLLLQSQAIARLEPAGMRHAMREGAVSGG